MSDRSLETRHEKSTGFARLLPKWRQAMDMRVINRRLRETRNETICACDMCGMHHEGNSLCMKCNINISAAREDV